MFSSNIIQNYKFVESNNGYTSSFHLNVLFDLIKHTEYANFASISELYQLNSSQLQRALPLTSWPGALPWTPLGYCLLTPFSAHAPTLAMPQRRPVTGEWVDDPVCRQKVCFRRWKKVFEQQRHYLCTFKQDCWTKNPQILAYYEADAHLPISHYEVVN